MKFWSSRAVWCAFLLAVGAPLATAQEPGALETHTLRNAAGMEVRTLAWGASLISVRVPDAAGQAGEVTLGFDDSARYQGPHPFFGATVGRYANRIGGARFSLDGKSYTLTANEGANQLHGGKRGFDKRVWKAETAGPATVRYTYTSADGEEGFPGALQVSVTYSLSERNELRLDYEATADRPTVINLSNHTYWNLTGSGDVRRQELRLYASRYTVVDAAKIPTGEILPVKGTPLDFTAMKPIGRDLDALAAGQKAGGYDHNFVLDAEKPGELALAAEVHDPVSGRTMRVRTTQPGVQFYTANGLRTKGGRGGAEYVPYGAYCLETQHFPDSPNHPEFPSTVLRPGETFRATTVYEFSAR